MSPQDSSLPVLIIGAGLSGLALAHALAQRKIPFQLFERDSTPMLRAQGYRIRIQDYYLKQLLPTEMWETLENCCGEVAPGVIQLDALTGKPFEGGEKPRQPPAGRPGPIMTHGKPMNIDRRVLRNLMIEPLVRANQIQFGRQFVKYEINESGATAHFADGTEVRGRILIGADGARSLVRDQLTPEFRRLDTGIRAIFGKSPISEELLSKMPDGVFGRLCLMSDRREPGKPTSLACDTMQFKSRQKVNDVDLPDDYIYWVMTLRGDMTGIEDEKFMHLPRELCAKTSMDHTAGWHESCRAVLEGQNVNETATLAFGTAHPDLDVWESNGRVTLMGDAAHPMTPVGGVGANAAFQDAAVLLKTIEAGASINNVAAYEAEMRQHAREYIVRSVEAGTQMFGMDAVNELKPWTL